MLDPLTILLVLAGGAVFHAALFLLSRYVNPMGVLIALFMVAAPLSVSELPGVSVFKWGRVYITVLMVLLGVFAYRIVFPKMHALLWMVYLIGFTAAGIYSNAPVDAVIFKGVFLTAGLSGVYMAYSLKGPDEFDQVMRMLLFAAAGFGVAMFLALLLNPASITAIGRFQPFGINSNRLAQSIAPTVIICVYGGLFEKSKFWKLVSLGTLGILSICLLLTGTRGGVAFAALGSLAVILPKLKRPDVVGSVGGVAGLGLLATQKIFSADTNRLTEVNLDTREGIWTTNMRYFQESPLFGHGWLSIRLNERLSMYNAHSIYFQTLIETGIVGAAFLGLLLLIFVATGLKLFLRSRRVHPRFFSQTCLTLGLVWATLAHGFVESGTYSGGTIAASLLGFGIAMFDRLKEFMDDYEASEQPLISSIPEEQEDPGPNDFGLGVDEPWRGPVAGW